VDAIDLTHSFSGVLLYLVTHRCGVVACSLLDISEQDV